MGVDEAQPRLLPYVVPNGGPRPCAAPTIYLLRVRHPLPVAARQREYDPTSARPPGTVRHSRSVRAGPLDSGYLVVVVRLGFALVLGLETDGQPVAHIRRSLPPGDSASSAFLHNRLLDNRGRNLVRQLDSAPALRGIHVRSVQLDRLPVAPVTRRPRPAGSSDMFCGSWLLI